MIKTVSNDTELALELANAGNKLVILDFFANWCAPCKKIAPVYENLAEQHKDVIFLKSDVDVNLESTSKYQICSMPTFLFFKDNQLVDRFSGASGQKIESNIFRFKK